MVTYDLEAATPIPNDRAELLSKLKWLMLFRVLMISAFLGANLFFGTWTAGGTDESLERWFSMVVVGVYVLTLVYAMIIGRVRNLALFTHVQITGDVLLAAFLVWGTGGVESLFTFLFSLAIINGAILLYRVGALVTAATASVAFVGLAIIEELAPEAMRPMLDSPSGPRNLYYVTFVHVSSFFLVALLAGHLSELLRKTGTRLAETSINMERARAMHRNIASSMAGGLVIVDNGEIVYFNPAAEKMTGLKAREVLRKPLAEVLPDVSLDPEQRPTGEERIPTPLPAEAILPRSMTFERADGRLVRIDYRVSPIHIKGDPRAGTLILMQDVTWRHELEEAINRSRRLASVGELAAGIAHEIRNPLAAISGAVQLLASGAQGDELEVLEEIVQTETQRLDRLISDFLTFARPPRAGLAPVSLSEVVDRTLRLFRQDARGEADVRVEVDVPEDLWIMGNADQLVQVLWNLLTNAAQAMEARGHGTIRLRASVQTVPGEEARPWVQLEVEDDGPGMTPEILHRIFDPFFTTRESGTGLGLAIVHRILEEHGALVDVRSTPGRGTTFSILFSQAERP